jgi:putative transposase
MDNSSIHRKNVIRELVEPGGHQLLFLPKYSPDLNEIEHDFSALKRAKMYSPINSLLMKLFVIIIPNYVSFLFTKTISSIFHLGKRFKFCICK